MLCPTPPERLTDAHGRPYFLWDLDLSLAEFRAKLADPDVAIRAYWLGRVMRDAKPDDVFLFVSLAEIRDLWDSVQPYLGRSRAFWEWLLETCRARE